MSADAIGDLLQQTLATIFAISAPVLFTGLAVGFLISIFQAATQINEVTLVFIPKMFATGLVIWLTGSFVYDELASFFGEIALALPEIARGGP